MTPDPSPVPAEAVTDEMILAAQAYDLAHRGESVSRLWTAPPDRQVARLIAGAMPAILAAERERIKRILADHARHNRPCAACRRDGRPWVTLVNLINVIRDGF